MVIAIPKLFRRRSEIKGQQAENLVVIIHRFGAENIGEFVSQQQVNKRLEREGFVLTPQIQSFVGHVMRDSFVDSTGGWMFKVEAYYRYLEYIEMVEAAKNSKQAGRNAWVAIAISAALAGIQIWIELND